MFKNYPIIYAHVSAMSNSNFVLQEKIIVKNGEEYDIKSRECPHRGYLMHEPGDKINTITCKLHGFAWDQLGNPSIQHSSCSHFYRLHHHGTAEVGNTGLLFQNFKEPTNAYWVNVLASEKNLKYEKSILGNSNGSWLWLMEQMTDILHLNQNGIHPRQSLETPLKEIETGFGEDWAIQIYPTCYGPKGFWLFVYPGFNVEYEPGKLLITRVVPNNINNEYGFTWHMQFYYDPKVDQTEKEVWEKCIDVYREDIKAIENIKRPFFPLKKTVNNMELQMKHWGDWYLKHKI
jgi:hypothetical protein